MRRGIRSVTTAIKNKQRTEFHLGNPMYPYQYHRLSFRLLRLLGIPLTGGIGMSGAVVGRLQPVMISNMRSIHDGRQRAIRRSNAVER